VTPDLGVARHVALTRRRVWESLRCAASDLVRPRPAGALPDFLVIGTQKGGTTSLFEFLIHHPRIVGARMKEVHYFDAKSYMPLSWYKGFFRREREDDLLFETTPSYLFHPRAAKRIARTLPDIPMIALLREPVSRALSHYSMEVRGGRETRPVEDAFADEFAALERGRPLAALRNPFVALSDLAFKPYFSRGLYAEQIARFHACFDPSRLLVLRSEDLKTDRQTTLDRITDFLGLSRMESPPIEDRHIGERAPSAPQTLIDALRERYAEPNRRLRTLTGVHWDDIPRSRAAP
jgi:hypothetical protein